MADSANTGIYEIVNLVNGKRYIGSAVNFEKRWKVHRWLLKRGQHHSFVLQRSWAKHGPDQFEFRIIERCDRGDLIAREQWFISTLRPAYNIAKRAGGGGGPMSPEGKLRIAAANKSRIGRKLTPEQRANISRAKLGNPSIKGKSRNPLAVEKTASAHRGMNRSAETRAKIAAAMRGKKQAPRGPEWRERLSAALSGKQKSPEQMAKLQEGRRNYRHTDEHRVRLSADLVAAYRDGRRSRERSPEYREKIAASLRGRKATPEARANQSRAQLGKKRGPYRLKPKVNTHDGQGVLALDAEGVRR